MIQDIHSHTYYSDCGRDEPEELIKSAIAGGITHFGICDHNYGIGKRIPQYIEEISGLKAKYRDQITLYCGIEIATINDFRAPDMSVDYSVFDYCLLEHIDNQNTLAGDLIGFANRLGCPVGIAHTELFDHFADDPLGHLTRLSQNGIFWELNVNYDSIHGYREHAYVREFMESPEQQRIVKESGIKLSVGFDGHRVEDYRPERVVRMNRFLQNNNIPQVELRSAKLPCGS